MFHAIMTILSSYNSIYKYDVQNIMKCNFFVNISLWDRYQRSKTIFKETVGIILSDHSVVEWRVRFTKIPFKSGANQECLTYYYYSTEMNVIVEHEHYIWKLFYI